MKVVVKFAHIDVFYLVVIYSSIGVNTFEYFQFIGIIKFIKLFNHQYFLKT